MTDAIQIRESNDVPKEAVLDLYRAVDWSSTNKPEQLHQALRNSHSLVTAWDGEGTVNTGDAPENELTAGTEEMI